MATHRFTIDVPNPTARAQRPVISLDRVTPSQLRRLGYDVPKAALRIERAFLSEDTCAEDGPAELELRLRPRTSTTLHLTVITKAPTHPAVTGFHVVDTRAGKVEGGVTVICADPPLVEPAGGTLPAANPCPVSTAADPYAVDPDADPSQGRAAPVPARSVIDLVVPLTNPTTARLDDVTAYLEHMGFSDTAYEPGLWNIGSLDPGEVFYAVWRVQTPSTGTVAATLVVDSGGSEPTRLVAPFRVRSTRR